MPGKQIVFGDDARTALERGIAALTEAVRVTLGPRGRNVVLEKKFGSPTITNDGVYVQVSPCSSYAKIWRARPWLLW